MKRVVIIDDSPTILRLAQNTLQTAGYAVDALDDPSDFETVDGDQPDLILIDVNMPQFYGDDIVPFLREEWGISAPIYLFSNVPEEELKKRAQECDADGYISKEWGLERLLAVVQIILGTAAARSSA